MNMDKTAVMTAAAGLAVLGLAGRANAQAQKVTLYFDQNPGGGAIQVPGTGDFKVLNYALALEDLETALYQQALARLTTGGTSDIGTTIPGLGIVSGPDIEYLQEFGQVEEEHSTFLRTAIQNAGGTPVPVFAFDFGLETMSRAEVSTLVYLAELTGVSAYLGAITKFATKNYIAVAAAILGTEARHTAALAAVLNADPFNTTPPINTAPLATDSQGRDTPIEPDRILNLGFSVADGLTPGPGGNMPPVSGPNGFVYDPATVPGT